MFDILIKNAVIDGYNGQMDIAIQGDKIVKICQKIQTSATQTIQANGNLVIPPFVDSHFHLDSALTLPLTGVNKTGTVLEGIQMWNTLKPTLTYDMVKSHALKYCHWAVAQGILAIRSHVDICDNDMVRVQALLDVKKEIAPYLDLQLVAFPQDGYLRDKNAVKNLNRALDLGVDMVGGIPHFERTMQQGAESIHALMKIASDRGLMVDMHCDETDDPMSRHIETLCERTVYYGMQGMVSASHVTAMHSYDRFYFEKLKALLTESQMHIVTNPNINITLQGRLDGLLKRRGYAPISVLGDMGLKISMAQDCVLDPWYSSGRADMFDVAHMGYHIAHMTAPHQIEKCFDMITNNPAHIMGLQGYGVAQGCYADLVVLNAPCKSEALRLKSEKLWVIRRGQVVAKTTPANTTVNLFDISQDIHFTINS